MPLSFRTSAGRDIEFIEGFFDAHKKPGYVSDNVFVEEVVKDRSKLHSPLLPYSGFVKDIGVFSLAADALRAVGLRGPWKKALDVGGAEGAVARLMRGSGMADWVACNDYVDLLDRLPVGKFREYFLRFRVARATGGKLPKFRLPNIAHNLSPMAVNSQTYNTVRLKNQPLIDEYIAGDFYNIDRGRRFDFISSLLVINYFDAEAKIERVAELLEDGGVFVLLASSFWWAVNAALVVGDFPYASQRLTRQELEAYLLAHHPSDAEDALKRYDYFHKTGHKPTLDDYIDIAERHGLSVLKSDYLIPTATKHKKTPLPPSAIEQSIDVSLADILSDIQRHRPDVRMVDLKAAYVMAVFQKRSKPTMTAKELMNVNNA